MGISVSDGLHIGRRRKFVKSGPIVSGLCLVVVIGFGIWLYISQPQLINFVEVARQIENGSLDQLTIELMAVMLPIAILMCLVILAGVAGLGWVWLSSERRYLRIIDELSGQP
jgi:peptidoglycan biosynthesis protein MviN/MurJ (putative lipid II flippase)